MQHLAGGEAPLMPLRNRLYERAGQLAETLIRLGVRLCGKKVTREEAPWLESPIGPHGRIGEGLYESLARQEGLTLRRDDPQAGLVADFRTLKSPHFDPEKVRPEIRHFYEHTALYGMEVWSQASVLTRPFLWLLVTFVSRRMDQLNFPVSPLDTSRGMSSEVLQLVDEGTGRVVYTGWLRKLTGSGRVVYTGFYSVGRPGSFEGNCVKVTFPLPRGSATVFLRPEAQPDGSFKLISAGSGFGEPGFYRMVEAGPGHWRVRYLRTLHEFFHVWLDEAGVLRTDHTVRFLGLTVLRLHYKLVKHEAAPRPAAP
jgi:hypothetical protein